MTGVLFISFVQPFPADTGKKAVLQGLVRYFLTRPGVRVDYVLIGGAVPADRAEANLTFQRIDQAPSLIQLLAGLVRSFRRQEPLQQTVLYSDSLRQVIQERIAAIKPHIVIYDTIRVSQFVPNPRALLPDAKHVLYLDDLFSVRYAAMLEAMDRHPGLRLEPLGNFAPHVPRISRPLLNARLLCRYLLRREMRLVKEVEAAETAKFDLSLLVNRAEVDVLRQRSRRDTIASVPIELPARPQATPVRDHRGRPEFVFIGALNVAHNQCSLEYFIDKVFADCVALMPGIRLHVVGHGPSERLRRLFARYPQNIDWIEWIADLGEVFARCAAMIVPLLFGSGVKVKTLHALSCALPVVSTQFGAEGIMSDPAQGCGIVVESDVRRFPARMRALLEPETNKRLSDEAQRYYAMTCGAEVNARRYGELFGV